MPAPSTQQRVVQSPPHDGFFWLLQIKHQTTAVHPFGAPFSLFLFYNYWAKKMMTFSRPVRIALLLLLLAAAAASAADLGRDLNLHSSNTTELFHHFLARFRRSYVAGSAEYRRRLEHFKVRATAGRHARVRGATLTLRTLIHRTRTMWRAPRP